MPGRQAHGRPLLGGSKKSAPKPNRTSKSKAKSRALDAFGIAQEQFPTKEKRTPRFREIAEAEVGQKHGRSQNDDEDEDDEDDDGEDEQPRRKKVKPSGPSRGADDDDDEWHSDSEGNEWHYGVGTDEDSEIDSDEAYGEFDEETYHKTSKPKTKRSKVDSDDEDFDDPDDFEAGDDGADLGEEAIDLAQALDMAEDESDEEEADGDDESGSGSEEDDDASSPPSSEDEDENEDDDDDADPNKMAQLKSFIKDYGGKGDEEAQDGSKTRPKVSFKDLGLAGVKDPQMKKAVKLMSKEDKETRPGAAKKLSVPLSQRQQDKLTRSAAYDKTNETLERWTDTVKKNRRAEHLQFPLPENAQDEGLNYDELQPITQKNTGNELEQTIMSIMEQSGLALNKEDEKKKAKAQQGEDDEEGLSKEALKDLVNQKRRERELRSREAKRQARIKKIKSKAYHRVHRKQREKEDQKLHEAMVENGEIDSEAERDAQDRARALERVGARHRDSRWAKAGGANKRAVWDDDYRSGLHDMARKESELRRRKEGKAGEGSDDDDDDDDDGFSDDDSEDGGRRGIKASLDKLEQESDGEPQSKLMKMKFMQRAEAAQKQANDDMIAQIRKDIDSDADSKDDEDEATEVGRKQYGGAKSAVSKPALFSAQEEKRQKKNTKKQAASDDEDDQTDLTPSWQGPDGAAKLNIGSSITAQADGPTGAWMTGETKRKGKKNNKATAGVGTIDASDAINAAPSTSASKPKKSKKSSSSATAVGAGEDSDSDNHLPLAIRDIDQLDRAFAGDDVAVDFEQEKDDMVAEQDDQVIDDTLPGWGNWVGDGVSAKNKAKHKGRHLRKVEGTKKKDRKDAKLDKVIINEKRVKNNDKYLASQLPHPFESRAQYERSLRLPMGPEWMTKESFQEATKPKVMIKQGIIAPMSRPSQQ